MARAAEIGLAIAVRGATRLCLVSTASMASGMPWPRIKGAHRASRLISSAPVMAAANRGQPGSSSARDRAWVDRSWNRAMLVRSTIRWTSTQAAPPPAKPRNAPMIARRRSRRVGVRTIIAGRYYRDPIGPGERPRHERFAP